MESYRANSVAVTLAVWSLWLLQEKYPGLRELEQRLLLAMGN